MAAVARVLHTLSGSSIPSAAAHSTRRSASRSQATSTSSATQLEATNYFLSLDGFEPLGSEPVSDAADAGEKVDNAHGRASPP